MFESIKRMHQLVKPKDRRLLRMLFLIVVIVGGAVSILCLMPPKIDAIRGTASSNEAIEPRIDDSVVRLQLERIEGKQYYRKLPFLKVDCLNLDVSNHRIELKENVIEQEDLETSLSTAIAKDEPKAIYIWLGIDTRDGELEHVRSIVERVSKRTNTPNIYCHASAFTIFVDDEDLRSENELP